MKRQEKVTDGSAGNAEKGCGKCPFIRMYDYGKRIYYCGHEGREDDIGKVGEWELPEKRPMWCPLNIEGYICSRISWPKIRP